MSLAVTDTHPPQAETPKADPSKVLDAILNQAGAISPTELARQVGCSRSTVHHHRTGYTAPSMAQVQQYAKVLGVPPALFFEDHVSALRWLLENRPQYFTD